MPMTNEQIVNALISAYQRRGVQMTNLLSDPIFQNMSASDKIDAIKQHAATIVANSQDGRTSAEKKHLMGLTAITAGLAAIPAGTAIMNYTAGNGAKMFTKAIPWRYKTLAAGAATAFALGSLYYGMDNWLTSSQAIDRRQALRSQLKQYLASGEDSDAVAALSSISLPSDGVAVTALKGNMKALMPSFDRHALSVSGLVHNHYGTQYNLQRQHMQAQQGQQGT